MKLQYVTTGCWQTYLNLREWGEGVTGGSGKLYNEEASDWYSVPNIVRTLKSRSIRWAGHMARMVTTEMNTGLWWGIPKERDHLEDPKT